MVRLSDLAGELRDHLLEAECHGFDTQPWVTGPPLRQRRVAIVTTAGLHTRSDRPFVLDSADYRVLPGDAQAGDLVSTHVSPNFDRTGFAQDWNIVFPLDRLRELERAGEIGSVADFHYSFMIASTPDLAEPAAHELALLLRKDRVDAVLLVPV
ncbi:MAG: selenoprotein B glycine/betaine/sarcosine/D-proline reductase [Deltaproteobacteria bacterium]|nr:selenoprotein B glycine/betaine/sarcosine/D-proline reductase [Deltaproteobacteria bacterium]MBW2359690.1 selenoprotein B glycine/betaine/sarcosine/D-proline reductase [Deltaproteobacteria bacterium]